MSFEKLDLERQNKIIDAAYEVFARHGHKKASMKDIAETAGISKSVLFKYFSTKENLYAYIFMLASDSIRKADEQARTAARAARDTDIFSLMRQSVKSRLSLFTNYPWLYRFSYTAAFDPDDFVKALVQKELHMTGTDGRETQDAGYRGLRGDIPQDAIKQLIFWVSEGYLEDQLLKNETDPTQLVEGYEAWINILEKLLKAKMIEME